MNILYLESLIFVHELVSACWFFLIQASQFWVVAYTVTNKLLSMPVSSSPHSITTMKLVWFLALVAVVLSTREENDAEPHPLLYLEMSTNWSEPTSSVNLPSGSSMLDKTYTLSKKKKEGNGTDLCNKTEPISCSDLTKVKLFKIYINESNPCKFSCYYDPSQVKKCNEIVMILWTLWMLKFSHSRLNQVITHYMFQMSPLRLEVHQQYPHPLLSPAYVSVQQDFYISSWTLPIIFPVKGEEYVE